MIYLVLILLDIKEANFYQQVIKTLGSYTRVLLLVLKTNSVSPTRKSSVMATYKIMKAPERIWLSLTDRKIELFAQTLKVLLILINNFHKNRWVMTNLLLFMRWFRWWIRKEVRVLALPVVVWWPFMFRFGVSFIILQQNTKQYLKLPISL